MNQYITTTEQKQLLLLPYNTKQLQLIQKRTISRIQIVSLKGIKTLKSINDIYQKIRIIIMALLIKIFISYHQCNVTRLEKIKKIIYQAKLQTITQQIGVMKQHLLKSVAQKFVQLKIGSTAEMQIIKLFNCVPFFDQSILCAIKQLNPLLIDNDCQILNWLNQQFSIKILRNQKPLMQQTQNQLCLIGIGQQFHSSRDCLNSQCYYKSFKSYMRFSTQTFYDDEQKALQQINNNIIKDQLINLLPYDKIDTQSDNYSMHHGICTAIQSISPSIHSPKNRKQKDQNYLDSSKEIAFTKSNKKLEQKDKIIKIKRYYNNEKNSIWKLFCCNFDNS